MFEAILNSKIEVYIGLGVSILFIAAVSYSIYVSSNRISRCIKKYYLDKEIVVGEIKTLNLNEKVRYGVPMFSFLEFYNVIFAFYNYSFAYMRKVELTDKYDREFTSYLELKVKLGKIISIKEFDLYEF